ncbi:hypothetical protein BpHYR1_013655 [Brachionus plicatilis]|uniref:Uncharacterized protein n=1 Tax=Brachionus plicatilis TaxID=10195 RepID=A0A3M7SXL9_BRAPC|nr:hypothetical protein BpHYR1_013655 [Brachionus plicatilis]
MVIPFLTPKIRILFTDFYHQLKYESGFFNKFLFENFAKKYMFKEGRLSAVKTKLIQICFSFKKIGFENKRGRKLKAKDWYEKNRK